jgi:Ig-like domain CHU_C associated/Secretion system C-terminal sorting domain
MRKKLLGSQLKNLCAVIALIAASVSSLSAQTTAWVKPFKPGSSSNNVTVADVITDATGNVYTVGSFKGTVDFNFGGTATNLTSLGGYDVFITKHTSAGVLLWAKSVGNTADDIGSAIGLGNNAVIVGGSFKSINMDFDPGTGVVPLSTNGGSDLFVLNLTASGNYTWAKRAGGQADEVVSDIEVITLSSVDYIYLGGTFASGIMDFFDPSTNTSSHGGTDAFICGLYSNGTYNWVKAIGGAGNDVGHKISRVGYSVLMCSDVLAASSTFDPGSGTLSGTFAGQVSNGIVSSFDLTFAGGPFEGFHQFKGNTSAVASMYAAYSVGRLRVVGTFQTSMDIDPSAAVLSIAAAGARDMFIVDVNIPNGTSTYYSHILGKGLTNSSSVNVVNALRTSTSNSNDFYIWGYVIGAADLGASSAADVSGPGSSKNAIYAKYANAINGASVTLVDAYENANAAISAESSVTNCLTESSTGTIILGGTYASTSSTPLPATFNPGGLIGPFGAPTFGIATMGYIQYVNNCTTPTLAVTPGSRCGAGTVSLSATPSAGTVSWYSALTGGVALATGNSYTTPSISTTTTYYAEANSGGCVSSPRTPVTATITAIPTITATVPGSRCGLGTVALSATPGAGTISWFAALTGGVAIGTGNSFTTPSLSTTTTYYASTTNGACTSTPRVAVTATVVANPTITGTTPASRCGVGTLNLNAIASAGSVNWFAALTGGVALATGNSFTTPSISTTTTYYASAINGTCASTPRTAVIATVLANPTITGTTPASRCGSGTLNLNAAASVGTVNWFSALTGGVALASGNSFTTPSINTTTTYYASAINGTCASTPRTSVIATVTPSVTPSIIIAASQTTICTGTSVTFTATPTNGGTTPVYQWKVNGTNVGTNASTYTSTTLTNGASVTCVMTSNATCASPLAATSNAIVITVSSNVAPSVSIVASQTTICAGASVTFTANPTNGGTTPAYQWKVNGSNVGINASTYTSTTLTNAANVTCVMTSNSTCASPLSATSNTFVITVNQTVTPTVNIIANQTTICSGTTVTFTANASNGGTPSFQWKVNGVNAGNNSVSFLPSNLTNGAIVTCEMTSTATCATSTLAVSNPITISVTNSIVPAVSIAATQTSICAGNSVTFTATPTNGGTTPVYQWKRNGTSVGSNSSSYTSSTLTNGMIVTCELTSNATCASPLIATSNALTMTVNAIAQPAISIVASQTSICLGANITFTASPTNGGTSPAFQWKLNGINVGTNSTTFSSNTLANNDMISCVLASNATCISTQTATSNVVTMNTTSSVPAVTISANQTTVCSGSLAQFTANPVNGGTAPTYTWKVNGINSGTSAVFSSSSLLNGDVLTCEMTSNATCANPNTATSAPFVVNVNPTVIPTVTITASQTTICSGELISFSAIETNGGTLPSFQWKLNGNNVGIDAATYSSSNISSGAIITCEVTSNMICASPAIALSNPISITVNPLPTTGVTSIGATLMVDQSGATYQWLNCTTGFSSIVGATNQSYTATNNGNYAVLVTLNGCTDTSGCNLINSVGIAESALKDNSILIYPNPTSDLINIIKPYNGNAMVEIRDLTGKVIYSAQSAKELTQLDIRYLSNGIYFVKITTSEKSSITKLIVKQF